MTVEKLRGQLISVVTPCFNEVQIIEEMIERVRAVMESNGYLYEHIVIDNASTDGSQDVLRRIAEHDPRVRIIFNNRNFGPSRSPAHAFLQARGDCVIALPADLQEPPELIPRLLESWLLGFDVVLTVKTSTDEKGVKRQARRIFYWILARLTEMPVVANSTGQGLFDRRVVEYIRGLRDPYPFTRALVAEAGFSIATVEYHQKQRKNGESRQSLYELFDTALLALTSQSRIPLRLATVLGFTSAIFGLSMSLYFFGRKILDWESYDVGLAPLIIGVFFLASAQLICLGIIGEYVGSVFVKLRNLPLVVEASRLNWDEDQGAD